MYIHVYRNCAILYIYIICTGVDPGFKEGGVSEAASVAPKAARGVWGHART